MNKSPTDQIVIDKNRNKLLSDYKWSKNSKGRYATM